MIIFQITLLKNSIRNMEKTIQPGVDRLNWYSLRISDYATACGKLLKSLSSIVTQVNQMKRDLDARIENDIHSYNLFTPATKQQVNNELTACKVQKYSFVPWWKYVWQSLNISLKNYTRTFSEIFESSLQNLLAIYWICHFIHTCIQNMISSLENTDFPMGIP